MKISRSNIPQNSLQDINSFVKIPITSFLNMEEITLIDPQIAFINALNNPEYRFITSVLSRRTGKTYIANLAGFLLTLIPNKHVLIISPNYSLSQISWEIQQSYIRKYELEVIKNNSKDKVVEFTNTSTIRMGSIGQVNSVVGRSYDLIIFDEAALDDRGKEAFNIQLRPTLDKPNSKCCFISTPRGNNWFKEFYNRGYSNEYKNWVSIHATYRDNPRANPEDIIDAEKSMTPQEFQQEYEASFITYEGQIFEANKVEVDNFNFTPAELQKVDVIAGLDVGFKDATAMVVIAVVYGDDENLPDYYILDEYQAVKRNTTDHATKIQELVEKYDIDLIFVDASAAQFRYDLATEYDISTNLSKKDVLPGISFVGAAISSGRMHADNKCINVLNSLDQYKWDEKALSKEKPKHDPASHMADAIRYAIYSYR